MKHYISIILSIFFSVLLNPAMAEPKQKTGSELLTDDHYLSSYILKNTRPLNQVCSSYANQSTYIDRSNTVYDRKKIPTFTIHARCKINPTDDGSDCPLYDVIASGRIYETINNIGASIEDIRLHLICSAEGR